MYTRHSKANPEEEEGREGSFGISRLGIAERRSTALGTPVQQPLMLIGAPRMSRSSRSVTDTLGRADLIANMTL